MDTGVGKWAKPRDLSGWRIVIEDGPRKGVYRAVGNICEAPITLTDLASPHDGASDDYSEGLSGLPGAAGVDGQESNKTATKIRAENA